MFEFFTSEGTSAGEAWSLTPCAAVKQGHKHGPHPWTKDTKSVIGTLGPYMCQGYPKVVLTYIEKENI